MIKPVSRGNVSVSRRVVRCLKNDGFLLYLFLFPHKTQMKTKFILPIFTYLNLFSHFRNDSYVYLIEILIAGIVIITVFFLITKNRSRFLNDTYNKSETDFFHFKISKKKLVLFQFLN
jgi:hypothetical protein